MKRIFRLPVLFAVWILCFNFQVYSHVSGYSFSTGVTAYTGLAGATSLVPQYSYAEYKAVDIGFTFRFNDLNFTQISFNTDGFASMGASITASSSVIYSGMPQNVIAPLNGDLLTTSRSRLLYETQGSSPNRVFVLEWRDLIMGSYDSLNFQIKLFESANIVEFIYGKCKVQGSKECQVGLKGSSMFDFNSRVGNSWENSFPSNSRSNSFTISSTSYPKPGLVYTWKPPEDNPDFGGGGEFSGGYYFANSLNADAPSKPTYNWVAEQPNELVASAVKGIGLSNGYWDAIPISFSFPFFGSRYSKCTITTEGWITFETEPLLYLNTPIPSANGPQNFIALCWDDMGYKDGITHIFWGGNAERFVITYFKLFASSSEADQYLTGQIILYPNGKIVLNFNDSESSSKRNTFEDDCSVGIENADGTLGIQYRFRGSGGPLFGSPLAVAFGQDNNSLVVRDLMKEEMLPDLFGVTTDDTQRKYVLHYNLHEPCSMELEILNTSGIVVEHFENRMMDKGIYQTEWHASDIAAGLYIAKLRAGNRQVCRKILVY